MAREAAKIVYVKKSDLPENMPEGIETVEVKRKLRSSRPADADKNWMATADSRVLTLNVPVPNASGVVAIATFLTEVYGIDGPRFCAEAIRNAIATAVATKTPLGKEGDSARMVPLISPLRVVDKSELIGARASVWTKENPGKMPTPAQLAEWYTGLI